MHGPLPQSEFEAVYATVPRLTVELVIVSGEGVLLSLRSNGPCSGLWHLPGGTVRYGEHLTDAVTRVARDELSLDVEVGELLGYLEYPSHLAQGIDWPVGIAFRCGFTPHDDGAPVALPTSARWFRDLPGEIHAEQRDFLVGRVLAR